MGYVLKYLREKRRNSTRNLLFSSAITNVSQAYVAYFGALYCGFKDNVLAMFGQLINMYIGCFY